MENIDPTIKESILKLKKANLNELLVLLPVFEEINKNLKALAQKEAPETPEITFPEVQKIEIAGVEVITLKGDKGDRGDQGEKGEPGMDGTNGKDGKNGVNGTNGLDGEDGDDGKDGASGLPGKDGSPDTPTQIVEKLSSLEGDERLDKSAIKGLGELEKSIDTRFSNIPRGGARASQSTKLYPLTADGSTKIFLVPKSVSGFLLCSDNLPSPLMENNGYTINGTRTQITLTTDNAPTAGAQLLYVYQSVFNT